MTGNSPVIALEIDGDARAYPLAVLTWHEIVNDTVGDVPVIVTFCPLCNTGLVFERTIDGALYDFGVSGNLRFSDMVMYDRQTETWWQQATGAGIVGELTGAKLEFVPSQIVGLDQFAETYPDGQVLSRDTGFSRDYGRNPYVGYDTVDQQPFLFAGATDELVDGAADGPQGTESVPPAFAADTTYDSLHVLHRSGDGQGAAVLVHGPARPVRIPRRGSSRELLPGDVPLRRYRPPGPSGPALRKKPSRTR